MGVGQVLRRGGRPIQDHTLLLRGRDRNVYTDPRGASIMLSARLIEGPSPAKLAEVKNMILLLPIQGGSFSCF